MCSRVIWGYLLKFRSEINVPTTCSRPKLISGLWDISKFRVVMVKQWNIRQIEDVSGLAKGFVGLTGSAGLSRPDGFLGLMEV